jgi:hypothetical protein
VVFLGLTDPLDESVQSGPYDVLPTVDGYDGQREVATPHRPVRRRGADAETFSYSPNADRRATRFRGDPNCNGLRLWSIDCDFVHRRDTMSDKASDVKGRDCLQTSNAYRTQLCLKTRPPFGLSLPNRRGPVVQVNRCWLCNRVRIRWSEATFPAQEKIRLILPQRDRQQVTPMLQKLGLRCCGRKRAA